MKTKVLEIRDVGTLIPALAVDMNPLTEDERYLLRRCGYACDGAPNIILTALHGHGTATNDPYTWGGRTWTIAHNWIIQHWHKLSNGDVVDVEFILGETLEPKVSERLSI